MNPVSRFQRETQLKIPLGREPLNLYRRKPAWFIKQDQIHRQ